MTIAVDAIWEHGTLRPDKPLDLPDKARVHVIIEREEPARTPLGTRLREIRRDILRDPGTRLLESWEDVEREVRAARGGWTEEP